MNADYIKLIEDKYTTYIAFDDFYYDFFKDNYNISEEVEVNVDSNNCVKVWVYDNEFEDEPEADPSNPNYIFANKDDVDSWLEWFNSDGHQNTIYYAIEVVDGIESDVTGNYN